MMINMVKNKTMIKMMMVKMIIMIKLMTIKTTMLAMIEMVLEEEEDLVTVKIHFTVAQA